MPEVRWCLTIVRAADVTRWFRTAQLGAVVVLVCPDGDTIQLVRQREGVVWEEPGRPPEELSLADALLKVLWVAHSPGR